MAKDNYLSISNLAKGLSAGATKLEKGKLSIEELTDLLDSSRDIYERLTVLRYKAMLENQQIETVTEKTEAIEEIKVEDPDTGITFKFDVAEEEQKEISPNQRNLLDEIQEVGFDSSVNEKYATSDNSESVAEKMTKSKIADLREGIALNQKFLFMNDLFQGDKEHYDNTLNRLNQCDTITEAKAFLSSEIENNFGWDLESSSVKEFITLLERKFN